MNEVKHRSCEEQVSERCASRIDDLKQLYWNPDDKPEEQIIEELGERNEYGLSFDYVAPNTFTDQAQGYFRYQISWGGPSDEFRFYVNPDLSVYQIEYWFLDWGDGASIDLQADDFALLKEIFEDFKDCGMCEKLIEESQS